jgi:hypothetical protein
LGHNEQGDIGGPNTRERVVSDLAIVTAGLANDVEAVNQYAAVM